MLSSIELAEIGSLVGDPARAAILNALMDGRALTAGELAFFARVTPQTASLHLKKLTDANLLAVVSQGRHRYFRLASPLVARMIESIVTVAAIQTPPRYRPRSPTDAALRNARMCYDHLAGRLAVDIADSLAGRGFVLLGEDGGEVSPDGIRLLQRDGHRPRRPQNAPRLLPALSRLDRAPLPYRRVRGRSARQPLYRPWLDRTRR